MKPAHDEKPWVGAPRTDAIWKRHTEDAANLIEGVEGKAHDLAQYYEMACHACDLEREVEHGKRMYERIR